MRSRRRAIVAVVAALAVFLVGATCTQAGCLIPGQQSSGAAAVKGCCAAHGTHLKQSTPAPSRGERSKPCPACQQPLFSNTTLTKNVAHLSLTHTVIPFLAPSCPRALNVGSAGTIFGDLSEAPPGQQTPTLLALRCAFLI